MGSRLKKEDEVADGLESTTTEVIRRKEEEDYFLLILGLSQCSRRLVECEP